MAHEAYFEGRFSLAADLIREGLAQAGNDPPAHLQYGDYLVCCGRLSEAAQAYAECVKRGGDREQATDHLVRGVAALCEEISAAPLIEAEALADKCRQIAEEKWFADVPKSAAFLAEQWNAVRRGFERRRAGYQEAFQFLQEPSDLVFVICPWLNFWAGYPPYGVGVLQERLRQRGKACRIADLNLRLYHAGEEDWKAWWKPQNQPAWTEQYRFVTGIGLSLRRDLEELARLLAGAPTKALGFACFQVARPAVLHLAPRIKAIRPEAFVVLGGPDCFYPQQCTGRYSSVLECVDAFVVGEGEIATHSLLDALQSQSDLSAIAGVYLPSCQREEEFRRAAPTPVEGLKGFPKFDPAYIAAIPEPRSRLIATNRGCVNRCDFCYDRKAWQKFRLRDPADIVDEIEYNIRAYGIRNFHFVDSATNGSSKHLESLCELMARRVPGISVSTSMMITSRLTADTVRQMRQAGFTKFYFGLESGSPTVLKAMRKSDDLKQARRVLLLTRKAGIRNEIFLMVGHPSEGEEEFQQTLRFLRKNRKLIDQIAMVNTCFALQDTDLAEHLAQKGVELPADWYGFGSWIDGDNHIFERVRRKTALLEEARKLRIPLGDAESPPHPPSFRSALAFLKRRLAFAPSRNTWRKSGDRHGGTP